MKWVGVLYSNYCVAMCGLVDAVHFVMFAVEEPVDVVAAAVAHGDAAVDCACADVWRKDYVVEFKEFR